MPQTKKLHQRPGMFENKDGSQLPAATGGKTSLPNQYVQAKKGMDDQGLRQSEETFRLLTEKSATGIFVIQDAKFIYVNPGFARMFGYLPAEIIGKLSPRELIHPDDFQAVMRRLEERLPDQTEQGGIAYKALKKDGSIFFIEVYDMLMEFQGRPAVTGTLIDVTERKRVEEQIALKNKQLAVLHQLGQALNKLSPLPETLERISILIGQVFDNRNLYVALYDEATNYVSFPIYWMAGTRRNSLPGRPLSGGMTEYVIHARKPVLIPEHVKEFITERGVTHLGITSQCYLGVPIMQDERVIGVIAVQDYEHAHVFNADHVELLSTIASQAAIAIENARQFERAQQELVERKRMEQALKLSEEKFRLSFMTGLDAFYWATLEEGRLVEINPVFEKTFGYPREEAIGRTSLELGLYQDPKDRAKMVAEIKEKGYIRNLELIGRKKDGENINVSLSSSTIWISNQAYILGVIRDVTEQKRVEKALQEKLLLLENAHELALLGSYKIDLPSQTIFLSAEMARLYGVGEEPISLPLEQYRKRFYYPDELDAGTRSANAAYASGKPFFIDSRVIRADGKVIWVRARSKPVGTTILGMVQDITESKQAEQSLRESELRYKQLFEAIPESVLLIGTDRCVVAANHASARLYGYDSAQQLHGLDTRLLIAGEDRERAGQVQTEVLEGKEKPTRYYTEVRRDGSEFDAEVISTTLYGPRQEITGYIGITRDISERKQMEQALQAYNLHLEEMVQERARELEQAQEQLVRKEKLAMLGEVAGKVGHELRNPLGVISGAAYYLNLVQPEADAKIKKYHNLIQQETLNAENIITDLLDSARVNTMEQEPLSVPEMVQAALKRFPLPASVQVVLKLPTGLPAIFADRSQMGMVLDNLLNNACQSMLAGGRLTISARRKEALVVIAVKDTGKGIPREHISELFEPLVPGRAAGIGLGMAVSKKLVEANGGTIQVKSEVGVGSTFTLSLPVYHA